MRDVVTGDVPARFGPIRFLCTAIDPILAIPRGSFMPGQQQISDASPVRLVVTPPRGGPSLPIFLSLESLNLKMRCKQVKFCRGLTGPEAPLTGRPEACPTV